MCFAQQIGTIKDGIIFVTKDVDLNGATKIIPEGYTLKIKNGVIKNGTLIGNETKLLYEGTAFDHVRIKGRWKVPQISSSMFEDLSYENALQDVLALANPKVKNTITIEKGDYIVKANKNKAACLTLCGNTDLIIKGNIRMIPTEYPKYDIIKVKGNNIKIRGDGMIVGDKHVHLGTAGEWGMGIRFHGAINASVSGLTIKDCWGDCIYVGGNSKNVLIEKCILDHGRRQGISVTKADGVTIRNCRISNVNGTNPQYAIDLEPNANDTVDHVLIENVEVVDCEGGFLATAGNKNAKKIGEVKIINCSVSSMSKYPVCIKNSMSVLVEHCNVYAPNVNSAIYTKNTRSVVVRNNVINVKKSILSSIKNVAKEMVGKKAFSPINIIHAGRKVVRNNEIVER